MPVKVEWPLLFLWKSRKCYELINYDQAFQQLHFSTHASNLRCIKWHEFELTVNCLPLFFAHAGAICEGVAGDMQPHQEFAPGGGRPEREAVGVAGYVRHEQRAGGDHPQPADVGRDLDDTPWSVRS